ncbi:MAG: sulfurtransferase TusA family protein [Deltaproteobacteria bacterium]|nr:sulfurtransferase TusA family protein [Deltaproteobacteria bacterium]
MKETKPDATIDIRDLIAPITLLKVEARLSTMKPGQVLEILCSDPETRTDLTQIVEKSGHRCISLTGEPGHFRLLVEKTRFPVG